MDCMLVDDSNACALRLPIQPYPSRPAVDYSVKTLSQLRPVLRGFRVAAGLTQAMVAARLGITQQSYAQFEANPAAAGVERLFKVLRLLNAGITLTQDDAQTPARATPAAKIAPKRAEPASKPAPKTTGARKPARKAAQPPAGARARKPASRTTPRSSVRATPSPKKREPW